MDEPASALDPISTQRIEELIAELKEDYCIAIVTHNPLPQVGERKHGRETVRQIGTEITPEAQLAQRA